jgi:hypothetical protein
MPNICTQYFSVHICYIDPDSLDGGLYWLRGVLPWGLLVGGGLNWWGEGALLASWGSAMGLIGGGAQLVGGGGSIGRLTVYSITGDFYCFKTCMFYLFLRVETLFFCKTSANEMSTHILCVTSESIRPVCQIYMIYQLFFIFYSYNF